jgi:hypothetical protein
MRGTITHRCSHALDVDDPLLAVNLDNLAVLVLAVGATALDDNLITFANWDGAHLVL